MNFYIGSIIISIIFQIITQIKGIIYKANNPEEINYLDIGKYNVINKKILGIGLTLNFIVNLIFLLIPGLNLFAYGYVLYKSGDKEARRKNINTRKTMLSTNTLMNVYEQQKSIEDALRIDGLSEEEINKEVRLGNQELGYAYITDEMYDDIKASKKAMDYLREIESYGCLDLTRDDAIKLLREYRKAFTSGSKENLKPIEKTLKLVNRQQL